MYLNYFFFLPQNNGANKHYNDIEIIFNNMLFKSRPKYYQDKSMNNFKVCVCVYVYTPY